jgi:hypothetical protein
MRQGFHGSEEQTGGVLHYEYNNTLFMFNPMSKHNKEASEAEGMPILYPDTPIGRKAFPFRFGSENIPAETGQWHQEVPAIFSSPAASVRTLSSSSPLRSPPPPPPPTHAAGLSGLLSLCPLSLSSRVVFSSSTQLPPPPPLPQSSLRPCGPAAAATSLPPRLPAVSFLFLPPFMSAPPIATIHSILYFFQYCQIRLLPSCYSQRLSVLSSA